MTNYESESYGGFVSLIQQLEDGDVHTNGNFILSRKELADTVDDIQGGQSALTGEVTGISDGRKSKVRSGKMSRGKGGIYADSEFANVMGQNAKNPDNEIDNNSSLFWKERIVPDTGQSTYMDIGQPPLEEKQGRLGLSKDSQTLVTGAMRSYDAELNRYDPYKRRRPRRKKNKDGGGKRFDLPAAHIGQARRQRAQEEIGKRK